jgi:hypothetical protein
MSAPHAFYSKMLAERTASRNVLVFLDYFFICVKAPGTPSPTPKTLFLNKGYTERTTDSRFTKVVQAKVHMQVVYF